MGGWGGGKGGQQRREGVYDSSRYHGERGTKGGERREKEKEKKRRNNEMNIARGFPNGDGESVELL